VVDFDDLMGSKFAIVKLANISAASFKSIISNITDVN
jgi:hypothetical protein